MLLKEILWDASVEDLGDLFKGSSYSVNPLFGSTGNFLSVFKMHCLFTYFWLHWVFVAVCRLSLVAARGGSSCGAWASRCSGFSCGARALGRSASVAVGHRLSCSAACGIFPDQGSNLSPALAGRFFTTGPSGKVPSWVFWFRLFFSLWVKVYLDFLTRVSVLFVLFLFCIFKNFLQL